MLRTMLQAKLHRARVTKCDLHYEGSCGIDEGLIRAAGFLPNQYIEIYNVTNGDRFSTYVIVEKEGSGEVSLNGAAARRVAVGDVLIVCAYAIYNESECVTHRPIVIALDEHNRRMQGSR